MYFNYGMLLAATMRVGDQQLTFLTQEQIAIMQSNCDDALDFIRNLGKVVKDKHQEVEEKFEQYALKLCQIEYVAKLTPKELEKSLNGLKEIFEELSVYQEDIIDKRFTLVRERVEKIAQQAQSAQNIKSKHVEEEEVIGSSNVLALSQQMQQTILVNKEALANKNKLLEELDKIKESINNFMRAFPNEEDVNKMLELDKLRLKIKDDLVVAYFQADGKLEIQKRIGNYEKNLDGCPSLYNRFIDFAFTAQIDKVKGLYIHAASMATTKFYFELLSHYVDKSKSAEHAIISCCQFFYEQSPVFRQVMSSFVKIQFANGDSVRCMRSTLLNLVNDGCFELFKMLIELCR